MSVCWLYAYFCQVYKKTTSIGGFFLTTVLNHRNKYSHLCTFHGCELQTILEAAV